MSSKMTLLEKTRADVKAIQEYLNLLVQQSDSYDQKIKSQEQEILVYADSINRLEQQINELNQENKRLCEKIANLSQSIDERRWVELSYDLRELLSMNPIQYAFSYSILKEIYVEYFTQKPGCPDGECNLRDFHPDTSGDSELPGGATGMGAVPF